jgi:poly-gamma-glutamate capsule biosynthesis protein CapA/YwtB (metallophosphatase superfamily)
MVYAENILQPSLLELARRGDFRAIAYIIDSYLRPQGIFARVGADQKGCLQVLVEFQQEPVAERLVKSICHLLWKINSPTVQGVRVMARLMGEPEILWKQSVRIITPANCIQSQTAVRSLDPIKFQTFRALLMMGSTMASFILGCWISYYDVIALHKARLTPIQAPVAMTAPPSKRPDTVQAALETVPVVRHEAVAQPHDPTVTLMFGGDVTLSDHFETVVGDDYEWAFEKLNEYREADVAMVNLENPLTRSTLSRPNKQFNFKADPEAVQVLTQGGIDIVNLANNHTMDYEEPGLVETLETLEKAGIHSVGAGRDLTEARRPEILEVKGQRIAYLGYYDANFHAAGEDIAGTNPLQEEHQQRVAEDIRAIRDQVDWVIVNYHWGIELEDYPAAWQIELAHATIDNGADLVVGHHPHVLQGAEIYKGRPIVYSLGNFIFGGNSRTDYETAVLKVSLKADRQMKVEFLPVEVRRYQARIVRGRQGDQILSSIERLSRIFDQPMYSPIVLHPSDSPVESVDRPPTQPTAPNLPKLSTSKAQSIPAQPNIESLDIATILPPKLKALAVAQPELQPPVEKPRRIKDPVTLLTKTIQSSDPIISGDGSPDPQDSISFSVSTVRPTIKTEKVEKADNRPQPKTPSQSPVELPWFVSPPLKNGSLR